MPYVDYDYYQNVFCGSLVPESKFEGLEVKAEAFVKIFTFDRITKVTNEVKNAVCAVCEALLNFLGHEGVSSESNDGYSVSYENVDFNSRLYEVAAIFLPSELLYRGL